MAKNCTCVMAVWMKGVSGGPARQVEYAADLGSTHLLAYAAVHVPAVLQQLCVLRLSCFGLYLSKQPCTCQHGRTGQDQQQERCFRRMARTTLQQHAWRVITTWRWMWLPQTRLCAWVWPQHTARACAHVYAVATTKHTACVCHAQHGASEHQAQRCKPCCWQLLWPAAYKQAPHP